MNPDAFNYNQTVNVDSGECEARVFGCIDIMALNYISMANTQRIGSCIYRILGCTAPSAMNYDPGVNVDDGSCIINPCQDEASSHCDGHAICGYIGEGAYMCTCNDGFVGDGFSCSINIIGCLDESAINYNYRANADSGLCVYSAEVEDTDDELLQPGSQHKTALLNNSNSSTSLETEYPDDSADLLDHITHRACAIKGARFGEIVATAKLSPHLDSVHVLLSADVTLNSSTVHNCSSIFSAIRKQDILIPLIPVNEMLSAPSTCSVSFDTSSMVLHLDRRVILQPGDQLVLRNCSLWDESGWVSWGGSITIEGPITPIRPVAVLSGASSVGPCSGYHLDGKMSSGGASSQPMIARWDVSGYVDEHVHTEIALANTENQLQFRSSAPNPVRMPSILGKDAVFTLTIIDPILQLSDKTLITIRNAEYDVPAVSIRGPARISIRPAEELVLSAEARLPACAGDGRLLFSWTILSGPLTKLDGASTSAQLYIAPHSFQAGSTTVIQVRATVDGNAALTSVSQVSIETTSTTPLVVVLGGGESARSVGQHRMLALDCKASSYDPDAPLAPLTYQMQCVWFVLVPWYPCPGLAYSAHNAGFWEIDTTQMLVDQDYTFVCTASSATGLKTGTASTAIQVSAGVPPIVSIRKPETVRSASDKVTLVGAVEAGPDQDEVRSTVAFAWSPLVTQPDNPGRQCAPVILDETTLLTAATGVNLVIRPGVLVGGSTYCFRLVATNEEGATAFAEVSVAINAAPSNGRLDINPKAGTSIATQFSIYAHAWQDDDLPLFYRFAYGDAAKPLTGFTRLSGLGCILPQGLAATGFQQIVHVHVADAFTATTHADETVWVAPYVRAQNVSVHEDVGNLLNGAAAAGDPQALGTLIHALAETLNAHMDERRMLQTHNDNVGLARDKIITSIHDASFVHAKTKQDAERWISCLVTTTAEPLQLMPHAVTLGFEALQYLIGAFSVENFHDVFKVTEALSIATTFNFDNSGGSQAALNTFRQQANAGRNILATSMFRAGADLTSGESGFTYLTGSFHIYIEKIAVGNFNQTFSIPSHISDMHVFMSPTVFSSELEVQLLVWNDPKLTYMHNVMHAATLVLVSSRQEMNHGNVGCEIRWRPELDASAPGGEYTCASLTDLNRSSGPAVSTSGQSRGPLSSLECRFTSAGHFGIIPYNGPKDDGLKPGFATTNKTPRSFAILPAAIVLVMLVCSMIASSLMVAARNAPPNAIRPDTASDVTARIMRIKFQDRTQCSQVYQMWAEQVAVCTLFRACKSKQAKRRLILAAVVELFIQCYGLLTICGLLLCVVNVNAVIWNFVAICLVTSFLVCIVEILLRTCSMWPGKSAAPTMNLCRYNALKSDLSSTSNRSSAPAWYDESAGTLSSNAICYTIGVLFICFLAGLAGFFAYLSLEWSDVLVVEWFKVSAGCFASKLFVADAITAVFRAKLARLSPNEIYKLPSSCSNSGDSNAGQKLSVYKSAKGDQNRSQRTDPLFNFLSTVRLEKYTKYFKAIGALEPVDLLDVSSEDLTLFGLTALEKRRFEFAASEFANRPDGDIRSVSKTSVGSHTGGLSWLGESDASGRSRLDLLSASIGVKSSSNVFTSASFFAATEDYKSAAGYDLASQSYRQRKLLKERISGVAAGATSELRSSSKLISRSRRWSTDGSFRDRSVQSGVENNLVNVKTEAPQPSGGLSIRGVLTALGLKQTRRWSIDASFKARNGTESFKARSSGNNPAKKPELLRLVVPDGGSRQHYRRGSHDESSSGRQFPLNGPGTASTSVSGVSFKNVDGGGAPPEDSQRRRRRKSHDGSFRERLGVSGSTLASSFKKGTKPLSGVSFKTGDGQQHHDTVPIVSSSSKSSFKVVDGAGTSKRRRGRRARRQSHDGSFRERSDKGHGAPVTASLSTTRSNISEGVRSPQRRDRQRVVRRGSHDGSFRERSSAGGGATGIVSTSSAVSFKISGGAGASQHRGHQRSRRQSHEGSFRAKSGAGAGAAAVLSSSSTLSSKTTAGSSPPTPSGQVGSVQRRAKPGRRNSHEGSFRQRPAFAKSGPTLPMLSTVSFHRKDVILDQSRQGGASVLPAIESAKRSTQKGRSKMKGFASIKALRNEITKPTETVRAPATLSLVDGGGSIRLKSALRAPSTTSFRRTNSDNISFKGSPLTTRKEERLSNRKEKKGHALNVGKMAAVLQALEISQSFKFRDPR
jgi:hypothetical protein